MELSPPSRTRVVGALLLIPFSITCGLAVLAFALSLILDYRTGNPFAVLAGALLVQLAYTVASSLPVAYVVALLIVTPALWSCVARGTGVSNRLAIRCGAILGLATSALIALGYVIVVGTPEWFQQAWFLQSLAFEMAVGTTLGALYANLFWKSVMRGTTWAA